MKNKLVKWLEAHPAIKLSEIARSMNIKRSFLVEKLQEKAGRKFDPAFCMQLAHALTKYGLEIEGRIFYKFEDLPNQIFYYSFKDALDSDKVKSIDKGDHFEYLHPLYKDVFDEFDLWTFITSK